MCPDVDGFVVYAEDGLNTAPGAAVGRSVAAYDEQVVLVPFGYCAVGEEVGWAFVMALD